jgi:5-(carboxyamino)imidazole ribonucleotide mutase
LGALGAGIPRDGSAGVSDEHAHASATDAAKSGIGFRIPEVSPSKRPTQTSQIVGPSALDVRTPLGLHTRPMANQEPKIKVGILTGSPNDVEIVKQAQSVLQKLGIGCELKVLSAHRTPERVRSYLEKAERGGVEVFIACAGMANHLAGTVAAHTLLPVIGVPLSSGMPGGLDALLSTVQMPPGIPVATVGVDGAKNAGYLAARILALRDPAIAKAIEADLDEQRKRYDTV